MSEQLDEQENGVRSIGDHPGLEVTRNQVVRLADVALVSSMVRGRVFVECLMLGPALVAPLNDVNFDACGFDGTPGSLFLLVPEEQEAVVGAIGLMDAHFYGCRFQNVGLIGKREALAGFRDAFANEEV